MVAVAHILENSVVSDEESPCSSVVVDDDVVLVVVVAVIVIVEVEDLTLGVVSAPTEVVTDNNALKAKDENFIL